MIPLYAIGWTEVLVIAGVVFVLFGATRIPAAFRSLGEGINAFKEGLDGKDKSSGESGRKASDSSPAPSTKNESSS